MLQFKQFDKLFTALLDRLPNPLILGTVGHLYYSCHVLCAWGQHSLPLLFSTNTHFDI